MTRRDQWACVLCVLYTFAGIVTVGALGSDMLTRYETTIQRYEEATAACQIARQSANADGEQLRRIIDARGDAPYDEWLKAGMRTEDDRLGLVGAARAENALRGYLR